MTDDAIESDVALIRVLLVDDHAMVLQSLRRRLDHEQDIAVVAAMTTGLAAETAVIEYRPDVVVLDLHLPDLDGITVAEHILAESPGTRILMLTGTYDVGALPAAILAGCIGFIEKSAPYEDLARAIRRAFAGEFVLSEEQLSLVLVAQSEPAEDLLTRREHEVLGLIAAGRNNRAVAGELDVSVDTVRTHVQNILTKLGAHSRLEAVSLARRRGLLA